MHKPTGNILTIVHLNGADMSDSFDRVIILVTSVSTGVCPQSISVGVTWTTGPSPMDSNSICYFGGKVDMKKVKYNSNGIM